MVPATLSLSMEGALSIESIAGPGGLAVTYTRSPATSHSPWRRTANGDEVITVVPCVLPGGHVGEASLIEHESHSALFVTLRHDRTMHEVLISAPKSVPKAAIWTSLDLLAPIGGWRVRCEDLEAVRSLLRSDRAAPGQASPLIRSLLDDTRFVAAASSTNRRSVTLSWTENGVVTCWLINGELAPTSPAATVESKADRRHIDVWTSTSGAFAATIAQRLDRCGGVVEFDGQIFGSAGEVGSLISMLADSLAN